MAGALAFLIFLASLGFAYFNLGGNGSQNKLAQDAAILNYGYLMFAPIPAHAIFLLSGVISLFFPTRKKLFPVLGIALNLVFGLLGLFPYLVIAYWSLGRVQ